MTANDRRMQILEVLCERRHESVGNLAFEFGVANSTIRNDIQILSCSYRFIRRRGTEVAFMW